MNVSPTGSAARAAYHWSHHMRKTCSGRAGFAACLMVLAGPSLLAQSATPPSRNDLPAAARPAPAAAAQPGQVAPSGAMAPLADPDVPVPDADRVRDQLQQVLNRTPPSVREVLRLDPGLLTSADYLAPYPELASFLARHPEITRSPAYFVGSPNDDSWRRRDPARLAADMWQEVMQGVFIFSVFLLIVGVLTWLIRTLIDYRRWLRLSRVQTETHSKLLDRLTSNEDLLAYMQTTAGRRFLELAPISLDSASRPLGAPLNRILWSVQAGVVLALGGVGLLYISSRTVPEVAGPVMAIGILAIAVGAGFAVSAAVAWILSKRLGLLDPRQPAGDLPAESGVTR
jgi:hypothetical protein